MAWFSLHISPLKKGFAPAHTGKPNSLESGFLLMPDLVDPFAGDHRDLREHPLIIVDGACGTNLQNMEIPASAWEGREGCNELLNLSAPDCILRLHQSFIDAGAMVLETNTFGASRVVLAEYGLEDQTAEINAAAVAIARQAIAGRPNRYVAGSIGPTTKLPSLAHIGVDALAEAVREQAEALIEASADLLILETCQDLLQVKTALITVFETQERMGQSLPVMVSVTIERTGTMLVGTDIAAVVATIEPFPVFSLGLNCATGPEDMQSHIRYLKAQWPGRISCIPNQGLPEVVDGQTVYPMSPEHFVAAMDAFVCNDGVSIVGGCCGTTPEHIAALAAALQGVTPAERTVES